MEQWKFMIFIYCVVWVGNIMTPVHSLCLEVKVPAIKGDSLKLSLFFPRGMKSDDTVDGRNPAPPGIYKPL